jgi:uncharacterized protein (TIGR03437 family)
MISIATTRKLAILTAIVVPAGLIAHSFGISLNTRRTGGSFLGEKSCAEATCHPGPVNPNPNGLIVLIAGEDVAAYRYTPGERVAVKVTVAEIGKKTFGFQFTARRSDGCVQAGFFEPIASAVYVRRDTATPEGCAGSTVEFPGHWNPVEGGGSVSWEFPWNAPPEDVGTVRFAASGVAADDDKTAAGDTVYTWEGSSESANVVPVDPVISAGGIVLATGTPAVNQLSPSAIATVYGQDFAPAGTQILSPVLDENQRVQTKVVNTCVAVNGAWTPLFAVFPTQINFQIPHNVGLGAAKVEVIRGCNTGAERRSNAENITIVSAAPAFFNFSNAADGINPIAALKGDFSLLTPDGMYPQSPGSGPVAPGDYAHLFASGLGLTDPVIVTGGIPATEAPGELAEVVNRTNVRIMVGDMEVPAADIAFVGAAPCCAGLYQVTFRVPTGLRDGNHQVKIWVDGVQSPSGPYIAVRRP